MSCLPTNGLSKWSAFVPELKFFHSRLRTTSSGRKIKIFVLTVAPSAIFSIFSPTCWTICILCGWGWLGGMGGRGTMLPGAVTGAAPGGRPCCCCGCIGPCCCIGGLGPSGPTGIPGPVITSGLVTNSIRFCWLFTIKDRCKKVLFQQTHNQGLHQLLLTVSWDLRV